MNICNRRYIFYSVIFYKKTALFIIQHWKKNCFSLCFLRRKCIFALLKGTMFFRTDCNSCPYYDIHYNIITKPKQEHGNKIKFRASAFHKQVCLWHGRRGLQLQLDVRQQLPHDFLHRRFRNRHERSGNSYVGIAHLGCSE